MTLAAALGFTLFGAFAALLLVLWYVIAVARSVDGPASFVRGMRRTMGLVQYHRMVADGCPCCDQQVPIVQGDCKETSS